MGSRSGQLFQVTTFGESHGPALGAVIEGCPPGLTLDLEALQGDLDRRRPGQSALTTSRQESDRVEVLSGLFEGKTTGTPIALLIRNQDSKSRDYTAVKELYRPGHGDYPYEARYGIRDYRGGGRASARETAARVAAAGIARQWLKMKYEVEVIAWVDEVERLHASVDPERLTRGEVEASPTRCPDAEVASKMTALIHQVRREGDTIGGVVGCVARGVPAGWGDPVFDKLEADLAKACLSLPACKGFEIGSGFGGTALRGSIHNDPWGLKEGEVVAKKNHSGGVIAGISTGAPITLRCAFKPVSTHFKPQTTVTRSGEEVTFTNRGRHDPCVLPRAVPIVEAAVLLTLMDHALRTLALARESLDL
jgi:chorismate synthase